MLSSNENSGAPTPAKPHVAAPLLMNRDSSFIPDASHKFQNKLTGLNKQTTYLLDQNEFHKDNEINVSYNFYI